MKLYFHITMQKNRKHFSILRNNVKCIGCGASAKEVPVEYLRRARKYICEKCSETRCESCGTELQRDEIAAKRTFCISCFLEEINILEKYVAKKIERLRRYQRCSKCHKIQEINPEDDIGPFPVCKNCYTAGRELNKLHRESRDDKKAEHRKLEKKGSTRVIAKFKRFEGFTVDE